jgi:hypothetical protein
MVAEGLINPTRLLNFMGQSLSVVNDRMAVG